jgi:signal transduction histidine kinase
MLDGLTDEEFDWLATNGMEVFVARGLVLFHEQDPADSMTIILSGEVHLRRERTGQNTLYIGRSGQITGFLPFSRMKNYAGHGYAAEDLHVLRVHVSQFPQMLAAIPSMAQRCVSILLDRVRESTRLEQQMDKLNALGKLAGNLAHEMNNPASAAQRAAGNLLSELRTYGQVKFRLGRLCLTDEQEQRYKAWDRRIRQAMQQRSESSAITISDAEEHLTRWLTEHKVQEPWAVAGTLAEANVRPDDLREVTEFLNTEATSVALTQFASSLRAERMTGAVLESTARIFELIRAIKDYSYMDQAPIQEIDIAQGLDNTLSMLHYRMEKVIVEKDYDPDLPKVSGYGSELNQVWMALLENALDAIEDAGTIRLHTQISGEMALVEIWDSGVGIPAELRNRIFEPFFTTKAPGTGLGLGLDAANRIITRHRGFIHVESKPDATCFQVRLPLRPTGAY